MRRHSPTIAALEIAYRSAIRGIGGAPDKPHVDWCSSMDINDDGYCRGCGEHVEQGALAKAMLAEALHGEVVERWSI